MNSTEIQIHVAKRILAVGIVICLLAQAWVSFTVLTNVLVFLCTKKKTSKQERVNYRRTPKRIHW